MPEARIEIAADDGCIDAFAAWPDRPGRTAPVVVLPDHGDTAEAERTARRLAARGYFGLVPDWTVRPVEERRGDIEACLDWLADERRVDDARVGLAGWGRGADLALKAAAWRSERIAAVAALFGRGFGVAAAVDLAQRMNAVVHLGYAAERRPAAGMAALEAALCAADVDFETETYAPDEGDRLRARLLDLFDRALRRPRLEPGVSAAAPGP